jgi:hypothetical protein
MTQPVRVPNVSPSAVSGLDHEVIGANAQEAYDENAAIASAVPEDRTTVDDLLAWVSEADDDQEGAERARAVLAAERMKPADDQRVTLVEPLEAALADAEAAEDPEGQGTSDGTEDSEPDGGDAGTPDGGDGSTGDPDAEAQGASQDAGDGDAGPETQGDGSQAGTGEQEAQGDGSGDNPPA